MSNQPLTLKEVVALNAEAAAARQREVGDFFAFYRPIPQEALDAAALSICWTTLLREQYRRTQNYLQGMVAIATRSTGLEHDADSD